MFVRCLPEIFSHTWSVWKMKIIKCAINQKVTIWEWWKWSRKLLLGHLSTLVRSKVKASFRPWIPSTWQLASAEKGGSISLTLPKQSKEVSPLWLFCLTRNLTSELVKECSYIREDSNIIWRIYSHREGPGIDKFVKIGTKIRVYFLLYVYCQFIFYQLWIQFV